MDFHFLQKSKHRLTTSYIIALSIIGCLSLGSQLIIRKFLTEQESDARIINIAGRQRMLSQKIAKTVLMLDANQNNSEYTNILSNFRDIYNLWSNSHKGLTTRSHEMQLDGVNSQNINKMFDELAPHYKAIETSCLSILKNKKYLPKSKDAILKHEASFLKGMNDITFQYDHESTQRIQLLKNIELGLLIMTFTTIFLEAFFIFRPAISALAVYIEKLDEKQQELLVAKDNKLAAEQEKLEINKLLISQLKENQHLQVSYNKNLSKQVEERTREIEDQKEEITQQSIELQYQNDKIQEQNYALQGIHKKVTSSINYAKKIQESVLGDQSQIMRQFKDGFILYKPKDIVSGDFYWSHQIGSEKIIICADCTGHGVPGAFMTMIGNLLLKEIIIGEKVTDPKTILYKLDRHLNSTLKNQASEGEKVYDGMDMSVLVIDESTKKAIYSGAKRPLYYKSMGKELVKVKGNKDSIGFIPMSREKVFENTSFSYKANDIFYICSDGFQDQFGGADNRKYMTKKLYKLLSMVTALPCNEQKNLLEKEFDYWKGEHPQTDDVLLIGIQV